MNTADTQQSQFFHIELYSREGSESKPSATFVANEAMRVAGSCSHVQNPVKPDVLYGKPFDLVVTEAILRVGAEKDSLGRKIRADKNVLLAGVVSFPCHTERLRENPVQMKRWKAFRMRTLLFLKKKYGTALASVVEHIHDEPYPHLHFAVIDPTRVAQTHLLHDGENARTQATKGKQYAYFEAMKKMQNDFYEQVGMKSGLDRYGPKRQRLTRTEWKERKKTNADLLLARTSADLLRAESMKISNCLEAARQDHALHEAHLKEWQENLEKWHDGVASMDSELWVLETLEEKNPDLVGAVRAAIKEQAGKGEKPSTAPPYTGG
ncbi:MAG: hypothetical protein V4455_07915 [Pseudomonadota bacterium]